MSGAPPAGLGEPRDLAQVAHLATIHPALVDCATSVPQIRAVRGCSTPRLWSAATRTLETLPAGLGEPRDLAQVAHLAVLGLAAEPGHLRGADLEAAIEEVAGSQQTLVRSHICCGCSAWVPGAEVDVKSATAEVAGSQQTLVRAHIYLRCRM